MMAVIASISAHHLRIFISCKLIKMMEMRMMTQMMKNAVMMILMRKKSKKSLKT